ncbi:hypothetical protein [Sphaerisporangium fuscum]|uniref:hypothetical protein n=1 Tax=Sphaerisporangium fuscum TaxID=2835868 RepID=UPI001BDC0077|nr:hypothetical protein [Sphaerisporangium fuscum]
MRLRSILSAVVLGGALLVAPAAVGTADAATAAACTYQQVGNHWNCVTPGAFCPAAAHGRYGYAKVTGKKYKCKSSSPRWRWLKP